MTEFIKYPSIPSWNSWWHDHQKRYQHSGQTMDENGNFGPFFDKSMSIPSITKVELYEKIHGTNCGVRIYRDGSIVTQSRNRIITPLSDNHGFSRWAQTIPWLEILEKNHYEWNASAGSVLLYGEWCGEGIQNGVGISRAPRLFYIFGIKEIGNEGAFFKKDFVINSPEFDIYMQLRVGTYGAVNLARTDWSHESLRTDFLNWIKQIVHDVEENSPFSLHRGYPGIGEGVIAVLYLDNGEIARIKFKGEKHCQKLPKKILNPKKPLSEDVQSWIESIVTTERLLQGVDYLKEMNMFFGAKSTGEFLRWLVTDIFKEEQHYICSLDADYDIKQIKQCISRIGRTWYLENYVKLGEK